MPSEPYLSRYQSMSHEQLYNLLNAGRYAQVQGLSTRWSRMRETAQELTSTLQQDLSALGNTWTGEASVEFHRRITSIVQFTSWVADEFDQIANATWIMGDQLEDAKIQSEPPHQGNDHMVQQATSNASKLAVFGPAVSAFGGVIGAVQGHQQDEEERQRAHQRMVNVVADLAADYDRNAAVSFSTDLPSPPAELPGGIESTVPPSALANIVAAIRALGLFGSGGGTATLQQASGTTHVDAQAGPDSHPTDAATPARSTPGPRSSARATLATRTTAGSTSPPASCSSAGAAWPSASAWLPAAR